MSTSRQLRLFLFTNVAIEKQVWFLCSEPREILRPDDKALTVNKVHWDGESFVVNNKRNATTITQEDYEDYNEFAVKILKMKIRNHLV